MTTISIQFPDDKLEQLKTKAEQAGVSLEEIARVGLEEWLSQTQEFEQAAQHVLKKNAELYERLS